MDHSRAYRIVTGVKNANSIISAVIGAGADAIMSPYGTAAGSAEVIGNGGLWLSVDSTHKTSCKQYRHRFPLLFGLAIKSRIRYPKWGDSHEAAVVYNRHAGANHMGLNWRSQQGTKILFPVDSVKFEEEK